MAVYYACHSGEDPDDLLQEAWVGLLEALPRLDLSIGSPEQHLIRRAKWHMLDAIKHARVRRCTSLDLIELQDESQSSPENTVAKVCVSEFAKSLNSTQSAIVKCLLDGLTWREAGQVLGCSSANVAYHVRQIRRRYAEWSEDQSHREISRSNLAAGL